MDQPGVREDTFYQVLHSLRRINWCSGSARALWPAIHELARQKRGGPLRVLDIATGGGDVPIRLFHKARRAGLALDLAGCDLSPHSISYAQQLAEQRQARIQFFTLNVLRDPLPTDYDVLTTSLFLHHLEDEQAVFLLRQMSEAARQLVLVNDLVRCRRGYLLAYIGTRLLSASPMVRVDGLRSVEGAFTVEEALALTRRAGWEGATLARRWPFRFLLSWRKP